MDYGTYVSSTGDDSDSISDSGSKGRIILDGKELKGAIELRKSGGIWKEGKLAA